MRRFFLLLLLLLVACSSPTPTLAPTAPATSAPGETSQPTQAAPTPTPPTATAPPVKIAYFPSAPDIWPDVSAVYTATQTAAQEFGWSFEYGPYRPTLDQLRAIAQSGLNIAVVAGPSPRDIAREFPNVYFVYLQPPAEPVTDDLPNMLSLGGAGSRHDQLGFMAGAAAGLATEFQIVTAISDPNTVEGLNYRNGFLHGVRYTCPRCRVQFIDVVDVASARETAALYASIGSDVFFAAAGEAGDEALAAAAQRGAWAIGSGGDVYLTLFGDGAQPGADHVLTSVYFDAGAAVYSALSQFHAGTPPSGAQPFSAANGAITLAPYRNADPAFNSLDQAEVAKALARLGDGALETGIDPATGQER
ncbi:MAG: BMP family lipoprotein [Anaerolineales bacterium]